MSTIYSSTMLRSAWGNWQAACSCGWQGAITPRRGEAEAERLAHARAGCTVAPLHSRRIEL